jgi:uncharacterized protein YdcH (DUF465 family)
MLLIIVCILLSVVFGVLSYLSYDGVRVIQYIISTDNLNNEDPLFINSNSYVSKVINVCANEDGNFQKIIQENNEINDAIEKMKQITDYNDKINQLNRLNCIDEDETARKSIIKVYSSLSQQKDHILNITTLINNISSCDFAKNDEMIILRQIYFSSKIADVISDLSFTLAIFLGISVLAGILFVHRHKFVEEIPKNNQTKIQDRRNESSTNLNNAQNTSMPTENNY